MAPARQHVAATNVRAFRKVALFTQPHPLRFLSNGALVGHIWVNRLNTFASMNGCINKALCFLPGPKSIRRLIKPPQIKAIFIPGHNHHTMMTMLRSLEEI